MILRTGCDQLTPTLLADRNVARIILTILGTFNEEWTGADDSTHSILDGDYGRCNTYVSTSAMEAEHTCIEVLQGSMRSGGTRTQQLSQ